MNTQSPPEGTPPTEEKPRRHRLRKALKITGLVIGGLVALVLLTVVTVLYTGFGTAFALRQGLSIYDDMIDGSVKHDDIEGSLAGGMTLTGLELRDAAGTPLVAVETLYLEISPAELLGGEAIVDGLVAAGVRVDVPYVDPESGASPFADITPPPSPTQEPPTPGIGPDLPLYIAARVEVQGATVRTQTADGAWETAVDGAYAAITAHGEGRSAVVEIEPNTRVSLPVVPLDVAGAALVARWDEPQLVIEDLRVQSDAGVIGAPRLALDAETMSLDGALLVRGFADVLRDRFGAPELLETDPEITLVADGRADDLRLALLVEPGLGAETGEGLWLRLDARGRVQPDIDLRTELLVEGVDPRIGSPDLPGGELGVVVRAHVTGATPDALDVAAAVDCLDCQIEDVGPIDLALYARLEQGTGSAALRVEAAGAAIDARAEVWDFQSLRAHLRVDVPDLAATGEVARRFAPDVQAVQGALTVEAHCVGGLRDPACTATTAVRDFQGYEARAGEVVVQAFATPATTPPAFAADVFGRDLAYGQDRFDTLHARASGTPGEVLATVVAEPRGQDRLRLAAGLTVGPPLRLRLLELEGVARGVRADLARPSSITLAPDGRVVIDGLSLALGGGRIRADGTYDPQGPSDLTLAVSALNLATLNNFVPGLGLRGRLDLDARVNGRPAAPDVRLDLTARGVRYQGTPLGTTTARVRYGDRRLDARLVNTEGLADRVQIDAQVPFDLDLQSGTVGPRFDARQSVAIIVDDLRLARLEPMLGEGNAPEGVINVNGRFAGRAAPTGALSIVATDVAYEGWKVPQLGVDVAYDGRELGVDLGVQSSYAESVELHAKVPLRVDLSRGVAEWQKTRPHDLRLVVKNVTTDDILVERVPLAQQFRLQELVVDIEGPATRPTGKIDVVTRIETFAGIDLSTSRAHLELTEDAADLRIDLENPSQDKFTLTAHVPVEVRPLAATPVVWKHDAEHRLDLDIDNLNLAGYAQTKGSPPMSGTINADVTLRGTGRNPTIKARVNGDDVEFRDYTIGDVELDAVADTRQATVGLTWQQDQDSKLTVTAQAPLDIDPVAQRFEWRQEADHQIDLKFVGIDRPLITQFVPLTEGVDPDLDLTVDVKGTMKTFDARIDLDGDVGLPTGGRAVVQGRIALDPKQQTVKITSPLDGKDLNVDIRAEAPIASLAAGTADPMAIPFDAVIQMPGVDIAPLAPVLPISLYGPKGFAFIDIKASGTPGDPQVAGSLGLKDAELTIVDLNQRLENINLVARVTPASLTLETLRARSGGGTLKGSGGIQLIGGDIPTDPRRAEGKIKIEMDRWPIVRPGIPRGLIASRIYTNLAAGPRETRVEVAIHDTQVRLIGSNVPAPKPIPENENLYFENPPPPEGMGQAKDASADGEIPDDIPGPTDPPGRLAIIVELSDPLEIRGQGIAMSWDGKIITQSQGDESSVQGALRATEGGFELIGRQFRIQEGKVYLPEAGGMPYIDVVATTDVDEYTITTSIRGNVERPALEFKSEPPLPDYQILTVLVTGAPESGGDDDVNVQREAASLLAAFQSAAIEDALNERLGIDRVGIEFGETVDEPILTVGKRITPNLYVETVYHHNAPEDENTTEARVRYRITPSWSVESAYGDAGIGSVDLFWIKNFGGKSAALELEPLEDDTEATPTTKTGVALDPLD
ncbi:MAG: translocation/assembly module TamB domain-containing protein [bacterium]